MVLVCFLIQDNINVAVLCFPIFIITLLANCYTLHCILLADLLLSLCQNLSHAWGTSSVINQELRKSTTTHQNFVASVVKNVYLCFMYISVHYICICGVPFWLCAHFDMKKCRNKKMPPIYMAGLHLFNLSPPKCQPTQLLAPSLQKSPPKDL